MKILSQPLLAIVREARSKSKGDASTPCLRLEHEGEVFEAFLPPSNRPLACFPSGLEVAVVLGMAEGDLPRITAIEPARIASWAPKRLPGGVHRLPQWLLEAASHPTDVRALWGWLGMLESDLLREFACRVFHDPRIALPFITGQASRQHHHAFSGGLLAHSLEAATHLPWISNGMTRLEWEIACIAALFHDVGKVRIDYGLPKCPPEDRLRHHEDHTFEVLAPHLDWMLVRDDALYSMLHHHLGRGGQENRPLMPGAILTRAMDHFSAACSAREKVFANRPPSTRFSCLDIPGPRNWFYRPGEPCDGRKRSSPTVFALP